jgi:hypothetical protein
LFPRLADKLPVLSRKLHHFAEAALEFGLEEFVASKAANDYNPLQQ